MATWKPVGFSRVQAPSFGICPLCLLICVYWFLLLSQGQGSGIWSGLQLEQGGGVGSMTVGIPGGPEAGHGLRYHAIPL
jgi:hypothetical protein